MIIPIPGFETNISVTANRNDIYPHIDSKPCGCEEDGPDGRFCDYNKNNETATIG